MKLTENVAIDYNVNVNVKTTNLDRNLGRSGRSWSRLRDAMLSTLFTGMQLDRIFGKMVDRNLEMMGGTDMLSSAFDTILLPRLSDVNEKFLELSKKIMGSSDATKDLIGNVFIGGWAFGKILTPLTNVVLLMGSLKYLIEGIEFGALLLGFGKWLILLAGIYFFTRAMIKMLTSGDYEKTMTETPLGITIPDTLKTTRTVTDALVNTIKGFFGGAKEENNTQNIEIYNAPRNVSNNQYRNIGYTYDYYGGYLS